MRLRHRMLDGSEPVARRATALIGG